MFGNEVPIREDLLAKVHPLLAELKGTLVILEWDVQMQTWVANAGTPRAQLINAWCLVVIASGALLGPQNNLSYVWTFGETPHPPANDVIRDSVRQTCQQLAIMRTRQLQSTGPDGASAN